MSHLSPSTSESAQPVPTSRRSHYRLLSQTAGVWSGVWSGFVLEVSGDRWCCWRFRRPGSKQLGVIETRDCTDAGNLKSVLHDLHYVWQPILVVLHPPTVCVKTFDIGEAEPSHWVSDHLQEIFPPGDRREFRIVYDLCAKQQLLVAVARKSMLNAISQMIWDAGGAIVAMVPAPALDHVLLEQQSLAQDQVSAWRLVRYEYRTSETGCKIWSSCQKPPESRSNSEAARTASNNSVAGDAPHLLRAPRRTNLSCSSRLDFLTQLKVPTPMRAPLLPILLRPSLTVTTALLLLLTLAYFLGLGIDSTRSGARANTNRLSRELTELQEQNSELTKSLESSRQGFGRRFSVGELLCGVAQSTPGDAWLNRLELQREPRTGGYSLNLSGFANQDKSLSSFSSDLSQNRQIAEAHLIRVSKVSDSDRGRLGSQANTKLVAFDLQARSR